MRTDKMIEVSDLFDAYHAMIDIAWKHGLFRGNPSYQNPDFVGVMFYELDDALEVDFFFSACARRLVKTTGEKIQPEDIRQRLIIADMNGEPLSGKDAEYISSAHDWGTPNDEAPENAVICAKQTSHPRSSIRLYLKGEA